MSKETPRATAPQWLCAAGGAVGSVVLGVPHRTLVPVPPTAQPTGGGGGGGTFFSSSLLLSRLELSDTKVYAP